MAQLRKTDNCLDGVVVIALCSLLIVGEYILRGIGVKNDHYFLSGRSTSGLLFFQIKRTCYVLRQMVERYFCTTDSEMTVQKKTRLAILTGNQRTSLGVFIFLFGITYGVSTDVLPTNIQIGQYVYVDNDIEIPLIGGRIANINVSALTFDIVVDDPPSYEYMNLPLSKIQHITCPKARPEMNYAVSMDDLYGIAKSLHVNGFAVINRSGANNPAAPFARYADTAYDVSLGAFREVMDLAEWIGVDPFVGAFTFKEVASRHHGRWEILLEYTIGKWHHNVTEMWTRAEDVIRPVLDLAVRYGMKNTSFPSAAVVDDEDIWVVRRPGSGVVNDEEVRDKNRVPLQSVFEVSSDSIEFPDNTAHTSTLETGATSRKRDIDRMKSEKFDVPAITKVYEGLVVSVNGAITQHWHKDANMEDLSHYSAYIAPADVTDEMGPTQFIPGTHRDMNFRYSAYTTILDTCPGVFAPLLRAGDMIIWDYRVVHRGLRNVEKGWRYHQQHIDDNDDIRSTREFRCRQQSDDDEGASISGAYSNVGDPISDDDYDDDDCPPRGFRPLLFRTYFVEGSQADENFEDESFYDMVQDKMNDLDGYSS